MCTIHKPVDCEIGKSKKFNTKDNKEQEEGEKARKNLHTYTVYYSNRNIRRGRRGMTD